MSEDHRRDEQVAIRTELGAMAWFKTGLHAKLPAASRTGRSSSRNPALTGRGLRAPV